MEAMLPPYSSGGTRRSSSSVAAVDVHASLAAFSGFGPPPASVWAAPAYALRVIRRRRVLTDGLRRARASRSQDVGVYEASLRTADDTAVRKGVIVATLLMGLALMLVALGVYAGSEMIASL